MVDHGLLCEGDGSDSAINNLATNARSTCVGPFLSDTFDREPACSVDNDCGTGRRDLKRVGMGGSLAASSVFGHCLRARCDSGCWLHQSTSGVTLDTRCFPESTVKRSGMGPGSHGRMSQGRPGVAILDSGGSSFGNRSAGGLGSPIDDSHKP